MLNLRLFVKNQLASNLLRSAMSTQDPSIVVDIVDFCASVYPHKKHRQSPKQSIVTTHTKSTRHLAERTRTLYQQPEYVASVNYQPERLRSVYDWLILTGRDEEPLDTTWLKHVLVVESPDKRIKSKERYENWLNERQRLVNDTLQFCDIVLNEMCF